jgi:hypothetical protein
MPRIQFYCYTKVSPVRSNCLLSRGSYVRILVGGLRSNKLPRVKLTERYKYSIYTPRNGVFSVELSY